jgi:fumarylacetoacetase
LLRESGALNIALEVWIETAIMRVRGIAPHRLSASNFRQAYWSISQMVAHHTVNGCNLCPGDLLGSGTQSGPLPEETGALIELTQGGKHAIALPDGEIRTFLEDGDRVVFKGFCQREGAVRIGFGEVSGTLLPARTVA